MEINALKAQAASNMFPIDMRNRGVLVPRSLHPQLAGETEKQSSTSSLLPFALCMTP